MGVKRSVFAAGFLLLSSVILTPMLSPLARVQAQTSPPPSSPPSIEQPPQPPIMPPPIAPQPVSTSARAALLVQKHPNVSDEKNIAIYEGSVAWSIQKQSEKNVAPKAYATVSLPEIHFQARYAFEMNSDPASLVPIEIVFGVTQAADPAVLDIATVGVISMRDDNERLGNALRGSVIRIDDVNFLIALAAGSIAPENPTLIAKRKWFDSPIKLKSNALGKITFEKSIDANEMLALVYPEIGRRLDSLKASAKSGSANTPQAQEWRNNLGPIDANQPSRGR